VQDLLQLNRMQLLWKPLGQVPILEPIVVLVTEAISAGVKHMQETVTLSLPNGAKPLKCTVIPDGDGAGIQQAVICLWS
jgi:hypothetical protein